MTHAPTAKGFLDDLQWFLDHLDEAPTRIHVRGVWHDITGGSALGSPMLARPFASWLEQGERSVRVIREQVTCQHFRQTLPNPCPDCGDRGSYERPTEVYRWPMRAAMAKSRRVPVRIGRPDMAVTLAVIARSGGDLATSASTLTRSYPAMGDEATAMAQFASALTVVRGLYRAEAPVRYAEPMKSDSQLNAEATKVA